MDKLPLIASGPQAGLPRVYQVASEIVAESGGALEAEIIRKFLVAFQAMAPLDIGELWALPLMLRLQLLECSARARDPGRATAKRERRGGFLGESSHHRRAPQFVAVAQDDGGTGGTASRADARILRANWWRISTTKRRRSRW